MLLYHALRKTFDDFDEVYEYHFDDSSGTYIETDKELQVNQVVFLRDINDYAIIITAVWEQDGKRYFSHKTAENVVVRARTPRNKC
ncbi:hypothetical protein MHB42_19295 [Lysinibacillus sp. FSL K6-0232]|uniref:hypothetical protein n=1 Tax=unclassified Lysinibacillus TaxID=2636778 RepID=UPI0030F88807